MKALLPIVLRYLGAATLLVTVFEACSSSGDSAAAGPDGPPSLAIASISLGNGAVGEGGGSGVLSCDATIGVALQIENWELQPPGRCTVSKCGQVRVSLLREPEGNALLTRVVASAGVDLDVARLLGATPPLQGGPVAIQAELINDAGNVFPISDAGSSTAERAFSLILPTDCGSGGAAGASNVTPSEGGDGGFGGAPAEPSEAGSGGSLAEAGSGGSPSNP